MIAEIKGHAILGRLRTTACVTTMPLADALVALSHIAAAHAEDIESIDINPFTVLARGQGAYALDALIVSPTPARTCRRDELAGLEIERHAAVRDRHRFSLSRLIGTDRQRCAALPRRRPMFAPAYARRIYAPTADLSPAMLGMRRRRRRPKRALGCRDDFRFAPLSLDGDRTGSHTLAGPSERLSRRVRESLLAPQPKSIRQTGAATPEHARLAPTCDRATAGQLRVAMDWGSGDDESRSRVPRSAPHGPVIGVYTGDRGARRSSSGQSNADSGESHQSPSSAPSAIALSNAILLQCLDPRADGPIPASNLRGGSGRRGGGVCC